MTISKNNLPYHELIGLEARVVKSTNKNLVGLGGRVVDETRNTIVLRSIDGVERVIPKDAGTMAFTLPDTTKVEINGSILIGRPEDRIHKKHKR